MYLWKSRLGWSNFPFCRHNRYSGAIERVNKPSIAHCAHMQSIHRKQQFKSYVYNHTRVCMHIKMAQAQRMQSISSYLLLQGSTAHNQVLSSECHRGTLSHASVHTAPGNRQTKIKPPFTLSVSTLKNSSLSWLRAPIGLLRSLNVTGFVKSGVRGMFIMNVVVFLSHSIQELQMYSILDLKKSLCSQPQPKASLDTAWCHWNCDLKD